MTEHLPYDAIVFDMDGVIVEPTDRDILVDAVTETLQVFGTGLGRAFADRMVANDVVPVETIRETGVDPEAVWHDRELRSSLAQARHVRAGGKPVYDDVAHLDDLAVPLGLVSNNQQATVEYIIAYHDLDVFETESGRAPTLRGAANRKPNPHYLERALDDLGGEDALYVGDSPEDLEAAHRAGWDHAFLRRAHVDDSTLPVEPTYDVSGLDALIDAVLARPA